MLIDILGNYAVKVAFFAALNENDLDKILEKRDEEDKPFYNIEFTVNGVHMDFQKFVNHMVDTYDKCVREDAQNLLEEKISEVMQKLQRMTDYADDILGDKM